ncbi:MAG: hypothetical protein OEY43_08905 [Gammaproteobacteria bacterium]|nr:hypothetical protein [Gammaproteobacteria bacterium]
MLDYILFHEKPFKLFVAWLEAKGLAPETKIDDGNYEISLPEDTEDELLDEIDEYYDELMDMNQQLVDDEERENNDGYHMAGVLVTLKDGSASYADVDPRLLGRVMSVISPEEFGEIVNAIANAVENPQSKTYCQRSRDGEI